MASLAQTVFLSSCILLLGGITEAQATSALIYTEQDEYRSGSVLHRLELPKGCVTCLFNCAKSCPRDRPLSFSWSDVEIGPVDFLYGDSKVFFFNKKSRMIESIGYTASSSTSKVSQHKLCSDKVNGIAVDWIGRNLFYTDARKRAIVVTSLRRSASRLLVYKDLEEPHGVAVDASRGTVCWTDMGKKMVECLRLNDMARTTVYSHRLEEPSGVTFDFTTGDLYWADRGRATIYRADPDGSDVKTVLVAQGTRFNGLTFLENITFVIDRASSSSRKIYMCQTGSCESTLQYLDAKVNSEIIDLTFYDNRRQSQSGTCSSPSCSGGMCVMTGGYASRCLCPAGKKSQGSSCVDSDEFPSPSFVYSIGNAICLDHVLQVEDDSRSSTSGCFERSSGDVSALCVHSASKTVYYYSKGSSSIRKRHLDKQSSSTVAISSPGDVTDLAVDQSTDTLYWTLMNQNLIRVGRAGVSMTWKSTSRPYAITVHAEKRKVFWSTMSARPSLNQASLDGSGIRQIISGGLRNPSQLAFDGDDRLYWIDKQDSSIYSVSLDGADKEKHFYRNGAFGIAVWQGYLAWTETGPTSIRWGINDDYNVMPTGRHDYTDGRSAGPISLFEDKDKTSGPCVQPGNGGCEQFCFARSSTVGVCRCGSGFSLQSDFTSCTAPGCTVLSRTIDGGRITCTDGARVGSRCSAMCDQGYQAVGGTIECMPDKSWSGMTPRCPGTECQSLSSPINGFWRCSNGWKINSVCAASCDTGYSLSGDYSATCESTGTWSSHSPVCTVTECPSLRNLLNGNLDCTNGRRYNSVCTATCKTGYSRTGDYSATCQSTGYWTSYSPSCSVVECPILSNPANGNWDCTNGRKYNSVCIALCNSGYSRSGDYSATCQSTGHWTSYSPSCSAIECPSLRNLINGNWVCTNGRRYNSVCTASCKTGYSRTGDNSATCQSTGYWTSYSPSCTVVECSSLSNPANGKWDCTNGIKYNSVCIATCNSGYNRSGDYSATCQSTGHWTSYSPSCSVIECRVLSRPANGQWNCSNGRKYNSVCTATCYSGYSRSGDYSATCQSTGYWTSFSPSCSSIQCPSLGSPTNGKWDCTNGFQYNSVCTAKCNAGYTRSGDYSATCQSNGYWTSNSALCSAIQCSSLGNPTNGKWDCTNGFQYNSVCTAKCNAGYTRSGDYSATCQSNGYWTSYSPLCSAIKCSSLGNPTNGKWDCTNGFQYNSVCTAKCQVGYTRSGDFSATCQSNGYWTSYSPSCLVTHCQDYPTISDGYWDCTAGRRYKSNCTAKCHTGHNLSGSPSISCLSDGTWTDSRASCPPSVHFCREPGRFSDGSWSCTRGKRYRSVCTAKCNIGFTLAREATVECKSDQMWTNANPLCSETVDFCPGLTTIANGHWECPTKRKYRSVCTAKCYTGYNISGTVTTSCQSDNTWTKSNPTCTPVENFCARLPDITNGTWHCPDRRRYDAECTALCEPGYSRTGIPVTTCQSNRRWTPATPECKVSEDHCDPEPALSHGYWSCSDLRKYRSSCQARCETGYVIKGNPSIVCQRGGNWTGSNAECEESDSFCPPYPTITRGKWTCDRGRRYRSSCTLSCSSGYTVSGSITITCQSDKKWSSSYSFCDLVPSYCSSLSDPPNGTWDCPDGTKYQSTCTAKCHTGYNLSGSATKICLSNKTWTRADPVCNVSYVFCPPKMDPVNGYWDCPDKRKFRSVCSARCASGYTLFGNPTSTCQSDGQWSSGKTACEFSECAAIQNPANGHWNCPQGHGLNATCTVECDPGYELRGQRARRCQRNGIWSGSNPSCKESISHCPELPGLPNGHWECTKGRALHSSCTAKCHTGFSLTGDPNTRCRINKTWDESSPVCSKRTCPNREIPNNATRTCTGQSAGAVCTTTCNFGHLPVDGDSFVTCDQNLTWSGTQPKCIESPCGHLEMVKPAVLMKCERDESNGHITCRAHCNKPNMITEGSISRTCVPGRDWTGKPLKCSKPVSGGEPGMLPIIIGTAAAGGLLLLLVVVITIACCCRRRERPEDPYMYVSPDQINTGGYDPYCPECATKGVTCDNHKPLQRPPPPARRSYVRNRAYTGPYEELNPGNMAPNPYNKLGMVRVLPQT